MKKSWANFNKKMYQNVLSKIIQKYFRKNSPKIIAIAFLLCVPDVVKLSHIVIVKTPW